MGSNRKQPFGYRIEGGKLVTHPEEQPWVVHIFCQYNGGASFQELADEMNAVGFPYEQGKDWNKNMISRILADCRYAGEKGYPSIIGWEELEIAAERRSAKQCQRQLTPVQKILKKKCSCKVTPRIEQAVLNLLNDLTMYPEQIATPRIPTGSTPRLEACKTELEELLKQLPVDEKQAQEKLMEMAAAMYEAIDSREYETTRMRRHFRQSELRTELDTEVIAKTISGIWITETGKIAVMLKNEQVMEMEVKRSMSQPERKIIVIPAKPQAMVQEAQRSLRVAAYCRVSTEEEEQQSSYEAQCSYYTEKIMTTPGWTMVDIYADEGISGTSTKNRDDFNRMIRHCRKGKIDLILTKSISRFARNTVDCLNYIRALKAMGIGICFEKENIDTLSMDSELIVTFMGAFAQSESESMSKNISWGKRKAMKDGKVTVNFNKLYGYRQEKDQPPEIIPEHAEVIQGIVKDYLQGASLRNIQERLFQEDIPSPSGEMEWKISAIRSILTNEKYCGDVLMQKTFVQDCISKKVVKNTGQLPMYLVEDNHPAIITREQYRAVQAEMSRRNAGESPSKKNAPTGKTSYASKYALSERLVCGECGTLYRRCVWSRNGKKKVVWRCVSRLDYGTKFCHESPTMEEEALQQAILNAINSRMSGKEKLAEQVTDAMYLEMEVLPDSAMTLGEIKRRLEELDSEFSILLQTAVNDSSPENAERIISVRDEMTCLKQQEEEIANRLRTNSKAAKQIRQTTTALDQLDHHLSEWDETTIRQLVHTVRVLSADRIIVYLTDGTEIEQEVCK